MLKINQLKLKVNYNEEMLVESILKRLRINKERLLSYQVIKKSLDARDKNNLIYVFSVLANVTDEKHINIKKLKEVSIYKADSYKLIANGSKTLNDPIVVVGFGPAGMFAALSLAQRGLKPIVIERGKQIEERIIDVEKYWKEGILNEESNVQFGEGGAGTFSDGKLTTRIKDKRINYVLEMLVKFGADKEILHDTHPHIGSDVLRGIVINIRNEIISLGGQIKFNTKLDNLTVENNKITSINCNNDIIKTSNVILAVGHSARDTFETLYKQGVNIESKAFSVGMRVEHEQSLINKSQYNVDYENYDLKPAEYRLTYRASNTRGVYTFCMCPGGLVVASASKNNEIVTNGMSYNARNLSNANSAILVTVNKQDFNDDHPLSGMYYQRELEQKAFILGKSFAPCTLVKDYLDNKATTNFDKVIPTYKPQVTLCNMNELFSEQLNDALKEGIKDFDKKIKGFIDTGILTGVESRTSSPLRILRNENLQSSNIQGLYPSGEGCGYAGGIISAAIDGIKSSEQIIKCYKSIN